MIVNRNINGVPFGVNNNKAAGLLCTKDIACVIDGDIYEFIEYLYNKTGSYTPMVATWEMTNCCNFSCPFCYINTPAKRERNIQTFDSVKPAIDDLVEKGLLLVYLTGGEILSVPDFERIYRYLKSKGVFIVLLTNLSLLSESHLNLFREFPPMRITTSVYGTTEEQFVKVTGKSFELQRIILENILSLQEMGINVTCQTPVNQLTKGDIVSIANWCYEHGIRFTCSNELTDSYYNESRSSDFITDEEFDLIKTKIRQIDPIVSKKQSIISKEFGFRYNFDCISGKHTFCISSSNHIRPCFNIWESDLEAFDGSVSMKSALNKMIEFITRMQQTVLEGCKGCEASKICGECIYTLKKHKDSSYLQQRCLKNKQAINELYSS